MVITQLKNIRQIARESNLPDPIIIALTASAFAESRAEVLSIGCNDFMHKPFPELTLFETIAKYLKIDYIYQEINCDAQANKIADNYEAPNLETIRQKLLQVEKNTLEQLYQASLCLDQEQTTKIIAKIATQDRVIGDWLNHLLEDFKFENIIEQLETILEPI